eukprot:scaffold10891_cov22-Tisochrysis_lutea.AAC.1
MSPELRLKQWLESRGCRLNNVEVKPSTVRNNKKGPHHHKQAKKSKAGWQEMQNRACNASLSMGEPVC